FVSVASGHLTLLAVGQVLQRSLEPAIALYTAKGRGAEALPLCVACMCCAICVAYAQHIHARRLLATHRFTHRFRPRCQYRCHRLRYRYRRQCCRPSW
ncbi:hypothetical protein GBC22_10085, partial [Bifidobacterium longum]